MYRTNYFRIIKYTPLGTQRQPLSIFYFPYGFFTEKSEVKTMKF